MSLNRYRKKGKIDYWLLFLVFLLCIFGLLMIYSSSAVLSFEEYGLLLNKELISLDEIGSSKDKDEEKETKGKFKLTDIKGLGVRDEKVLKNNGIKTVKDLSNCDIDTLIEIIPSKSTLKLQNWIDGAKSLLKN